MKLHSKLLFYLTYLGFFYSIFQIVSNVFNVFSFRQILNQLSLHVKILFLRVSTNSSKLHMYIYDWLNTLTKFLSYANAHVCTPRAIGFLKTRSLFQFLSNPIVRKLTRERERERERESSQDDVGGCALYLEIFREIARLYHRRG